MKSSFILCVWSDAVNSDFQRAISLKSSTAVQPSEVCAKLLFVLVFVPLQSSYSQLLAATCLTKLVSRTNNPLPLEQRIDIRKYKIYFL